MKLELKHLAPYLPYGLKCNAKGEFTEETRYMEEPIPETFRINGLVNGRVNGKVLIRDGRYFDLIPIDETFPILRPLSDLTKEIEHNGRKFIPMDEMFGWDEEEEQEYYISGTIPEYWKNLLAVSVPNDWDYKNISLLFELKFDIFGLIEKGLAININEIK